MYTSLPLSSPVKQINPMLGFRGCRLSVVYPEITEMQARAVAAAAAENKKVRAKKNNEIQLKQNCRQFYIFLVFLAYVRPIAQTRGSRDIKFTIYTIKR